MYCLTVHSLSPPKPAGLDPTNFHRRTLYYMRKSLGIIFFFGIFFEHFWGDFFLEYLP
jgi:hypothetical protein